jgi:hypothetical protein
MSRKPKPVTLAGQYPRAVIAPADVDDPFEKGAKLRVVRNLREHPIAFLEAKGVLSTSQVIAADTFRKKWEATQRGNQAIDYSKTRVDGGKLSDPLSERVQEAVSWLNLAARYPGIGVVGFAILVSVCGEGRGIAETAKRHNKTGPRGEGYISSRLCEALDALNDHMDQVATGKRSEMRFVHLWDVDN